MIMKPEILQEIRSHAAAEVRRFRKTYDIPNVPMHSYRMLERMVHYGIIDLDIKMTPSLSKGFDALARYFPEVDAYLIDLRATYYEMDEIFHRRRTNFTLAHEIAHIFMGHLRQPVREKTWRTLYTEEAEANCFAAELLMPRNVNAGNRPAVRHPDLPGMRIPEDSAGSGILPEMRTPRFHEVPPAHEGGRGALSERPAERSLL